MLSVLLLRNIICLSLFLSPFAALITFYLKLYSISKEREREGEREEANYLLNFSLQAKSYVGSLIEENLSCFIVFIYLFTIKYSFYVIPTFSFPFMSIYIFFLSINKTF
jgi:hypothetical protein